MLSLPIIVLFKLFTSGTYVFSTIFLINIRRTKVLTIPIYRYDVSNTLAAVYNRINFIAAIFHMSVKCLLLINIEDNINEMLVLDTTGSGWGRAENG
jgi:hypothetical protein